MCVLCVGFPSPLFYCYCEKQPRRKKYEPHVATCKFYWKLSLTQTHIFFYTCAADRKIQFLVMQFIKEP